VLRFVIKDEATALGIRTDSGPSFRG